MTILHYKKCSVNQEIGSIYFKCLEKVCSNEVEIRDNGVVDRSTDNVVINKSCCLDLVALLYWP